MPTPSSSLQTRTSRGLELAASGLSRPSLVVMSGTETTNETPLALISRMIFAPGSETVNGRSTASVLACIRYAPAETGRDASTGQARNQRPSRASAHAVAADLEMSVPRRLLDQVAGHGLRE